MKNKPTTVAIAEQMLQRFERDRAELIQQRDQHAAKRREISFTAHSGDSQATELLDGLHDESVKFESRLAAVNDAVAEARRRLEQARDHEAKQQDRDKALALKQALARFVAAGKELDAALEVLITSSTDMRDALTQMNRLGCSHPSHAQLDSLGSLALRTALTNTAWVRYFERVAPGERKTFAALVATWSTMVERSIQQRLGPEAA
jgi:hypothetical protein